MAARRKAADTGSDVPPAGWLLTFSDMVTLLLTFFVLIIAITTVDPRSIVPDGVDEISEASVREIMGPGFLLFSNPSLVDSVAAVIADPDSLPPDARFDQAEITSAVFQLDPETAPPEFREAARVAAESVRVFRDDRGIVISWEGRALFPEGGVLVREETLILLVRLAELIARLELPVSLECHTDPLSDFEGGDGPLSYSLAAERARTVLGVMTGLGIRESRFRLGAYGGARPVTLDPALSYENSRLEVVLYRPPRSSWKG
jgi:chemotaxis protein MotB